MFNEWQDSLRVESVITKSTHFVALLEYPRNSPHRAAWVSSLTPPSPGETTSVTRQLCQNLCRRAHSAHPREDSLHRKLMHLCRHARNGIFDEDQLVTAVERCTSSRLHTEVRRDSSHQNRSDSFTPQPLLQVRPIERTPLPFLDNQITLLKTNLRNKLRGVRRRWRTSAALCGASVLPTIPCCRSIAMSAVVLESNFTDCMNTSPFIEVATRGWSRQITPSLTRHRKPF